jgi:hypothetical protein
MGLMPNTPPAYVAPHSNAFPFAANQINAMPMNYAQNSSSSMSQSQAGLSASSVGPSRLTSISLKEVCGILGGFL